MSKILRPKDMEVKKTFLWSIYCPKCDYSEYVDPN